MHGEGLGILDFFFCGDLGKKIAVVVSVIILSWYPVVSGLVSILVVTQEPVSHVRRLGCFLLDVFVTNINDVVLSVLIGVCGRLWTISSTVVGAGISCREFIYSVPISASDAEFIMFLIICAIVKTAPLFAGFAALFCMK